MRRLGCAIVTVGVVSVLLAGFAGVASGESVPPPTVYAPVIERVARLSGVLTAGPYQLIGRANDNEAMSSGTLTDSATGASQRVSAPPGCVSRYASGPLRLLTVATRPVGPEASHQAAGREDRAEDPLLGAPFDCADNDAND
jgi:hypothetical protein